MNFISMANKTNDVVDCRMIQLEIDLFGLSCTNTTDVAELYTSFITELIDEDFFAKWNWQGRNISMQGIMSKTRAASRDGRSIVLSCIADVLSPTVYDVKSFRLYDKWLFDPNRNDWCDYIGTSLDYYETYEQLINRSDEDAIKDSILGLFYQNQKKMLGYWRNHDLVSSFTAFVQNDSLLYCGTMDFRVAYMCIKDSAILVNKLIGFLLQLVELTPNINARIALSPIQSPSQCSAHMLYFGGSIPPKYAEPNLNKYGTDLHRYSYLYGAEWLNILSPLVAGRLSEYRSFSGDVEGVSVCEFPNGAISVSSSMELDSMDVLDLLKVRKFLYPVLYPGSSRVEISHIVNPKLQGFLAKPRRQWECLPIFPEEIVVSNGTIHFSYSDNDIYF